MRIEQITAFLYSLNPKGIRFGLENTRLVLEQLDRPQAAYATIHLAGSNGKGSTAAMLEAVLRRAGLRVGLYTSPHLDHFRERFRVDGQPVADSDIERVAERFFAAGLEVDPAAVADWIERNDMVRRMAAETWYGERGCGSDFCRLTFFECTTVLALLLFERARVDVAILETGMGGRLDATNVVRPRVSLLTPIQLEHTAWLGDTIAAIAEEKAGIIKPGVPVVSARQHPDARAVIRRVAGEQGSRLDFVGERIGVAGSWREARFAVAGRSLGPVRLGLAGAHQLENAALAVGCLPWLGEPVWPPLDAAVERGLAAVRWPGRFERFGPRGEWILDGAHNPDGARALVATLDEVFGPRRLELVFGVLGDKDSRRMLEVLVPRAEQIRLARPLDARGRDPAELAAALERPVALHASVGAALAAAAAGRADRGEPVAAPLCLVTGSLTVVGEARRWLLEHGLEPTPAAVLECERSGQG